MQITKENRIDLLRLLILLYVTGVASLMSLPLLADPIAYLSADNVIEIDTATNTQTATISPNGYNFDEVLVSPSGNYIYLPSSPNGTSEPAVLNVYNAINNTLVTTIPIGVGPADSIISPDGKYIYISSISAQTGGGPRVISVVDTSTNTLVSNINLDPSIDGAIHLAIHPIQNILYVVSSASFSATSTITEFDTTTQQTIATTTINASINDVAIHPSGQYIYAATNDKSLEVIDTSTRSVVSSIPLNYAAIHLAIHTNGKTVYVTHYTNAALSIIDTDTNSLLETVSLPVYPTDVATHPSGNSAYVTGFSSTTFTGAVSVLNSSSNQITETISVSSIPYQITIGPIPKPVGGSVTGISSATVTCSNSTSGQSVLINLGTLTTWNCESSGLQVNPGDTINMTINGTAN